MNRLFYVVIFSIGLVLLAISFFYGGGDKFPDLTTAPERPASALEVVADLDWPPGNIAVSRSGRIFFTYHPEASPPQHVLELVRGKPIAYPQRLPAGVHYQSPLSLRIDRQDRLWVLDNADHGFGRPRLIAIDLGSNEVVHRRDFTRAEAGRGSHLNDFQVSPDGKRIYIADASIVRKNPALLVYDLESREVRRLLEDHESVTPEGYTPVVQGRRMLLAGLFAVRPGVDSIALDRAGEWLYFAPVTNTYLYRVRRADLDDAGLAPDALADRVERFARKTLSDGITIDDAGNIYLSDPDESAIAVLTAKGELRTLFKDPILRWPDGFSFGPGGRVYVTCSALHHVILRNRANVRRYAPYQIYRFRGLAGAAPGH